MLSERTIQHHPLNRHTQIPESLAGLVPHTGDKGPGRAGNVVRLGMSGVVFVVDGRLRTNGVFLWRPWNCTGVSSAPSPHTG